MVICRVADAQLVRELGQYIYQRVTLIGRATWLRRNYMLKRMEIDSFEPPKTGSIMDTLKEVHGAGGHAWDKIADPEAEIREMRGV